ncbi:MAG TPA: hypothetical protein VEI97_08875, partial [bacterium]|nr:hypothetical protein [bacterium]
MLAPGGPLAAVGAPVSSFIRTLNAASQSLPVGGVVQTLDQALAFLLISPANWAVVAGLNAVYLLDAWIRGADQFEYFRVRGYPERFKELRILEWQRVRTRNQRVLSKRYQGWNAAIERRFGMGRRADTVRRLVAFATRPLRARESYLMMTMPSAAFEALLEAQWLRRAPARRPAAVAPSRRTPVHRAPVHQTPASPTEVAPGLPPPPAQGPQPGEVHPAVTTPAIEPVIPREIPLAKPPGVEFAAPPPLPVAARPLPPAYGRIPDLAQQAEAQAWVAQVDAYPTAGAPAAPLARTRARPAPLWLRNLVAFPTRVLAWLVRTLVQVVPAPVRQNAVFVRDLRFLTAIAAGEREGIWSYGWTVLLVLNIAIPSLVYVMATLLPSAVALMGLSAASPFTGTAVLTFVTEAARYYLIWLYCTLPLFFIPLPIYAFLKERSRPDWAIYVLTSQTGTNMLAGKWALFMLLGLVALVATPLIAIVLNPMTLFGYLLEGLFPNDVEFNSWYLSPAAVGLFTIAAVGLGAVYYQLAQVLYFTLLCFRWKQGGRSVRGVGLLLGLCLWLLTVIVLNLSGISVLEWMRSQPALAWGLGVARDAWEIVALYINRGVEILIRFERRVLPLTPKALAEVFLVDDSPGGPLGLFDVAYVLRANLATAFAIIATYWTLAWGGHWLASTIFEHRLRGS